MLVHTRCEAEAPCPKVVSQSVACAGNSRIPIETAAHFLSAPLKRLERRSADEPERGAAVTGDAVLELVDYCPQPLP
jgi:hypothetical protein